MVCIIRRIKKLLKAAQEQKTYMETATIDTVNRYATLQKTKYCQKKVWGKKPQKIRTSPVIEAKDAKNRDKKTRMVFP